ncbi:(2,3-dihydroxybenzoyl)adenylate synthase [Amycolatopsis sp. H20-H5]|uniref:(2,3-dihydroxybenzoyl)adenylate synthase n=1 Tax=Amycolatopsis sp. H20-H5 TaxID=3046309 RepID=UPI002DB867DF|nr:AMP-binding protein [Amycolatopsis sp. H20-H5]MEC3982037.1 AMP-binding protein [Amycolatopsis sp. H20-H5]
MSDVVPWPPEYAARYRAAGLWRDRPLGYWMWQWADGYGDRVALVDGEVRLTYRQLAERADSMAEALHGWELHPGDRVLVQLPNSWEFVVVVLACFRAGLAPVMALPAHRSHELEHLARTASARALLVPDVLREFDHQSLAAQVASKQDGPCRVFVLGSEIRPGHVDLRRLAEVVGDPVERRLRLDALEPAADDVALFLLSGGTTGVPKMIARTHNDYDYNFRRSAEVCEFGPDTVYLVTLPMAHNFPLACPGVLGSLANGGRVVLLRSPEPVAAFAVIAAEGVTVTAVVPAIAKRWVESAGRSAPDLSSLRLLQVGGSVLDPVLAREVPAVLGAQLQQVFGMAEGLLNYTRPGDPDAVRFATQGRPICAHDEVRIVDGDDRAVPPGEIGELLTRGPYTPRGYYRSDEHNARSFTADGWYRTGDLVRMHRSGNLVVEGRLKDLVNRGGEKVSAEEIEILARKLLPVLDAVVVPVADEVFGERVCLVVVSRAEQELGIDHVREVFAEHGIAHYKIPELLRSVAELPLTAVGKVDKKAVREALSVSMARSDS